MHPFRFYAAILAVTAGTALSACTSTSMGLDTVSADLGPSIDADDPALPESVAVLPSVAEDREIATASVEVTAAAYAAGPKAESPIDLVSSGAKVGPRSAELDQLIARYAQIHEIPEDLLRRVIKRESTFDPGARNGPYWGLMQILPATARTMGYQGTAHGLLDAETNLIYAGKYLRGAYITAGGNHDLAVRYYSRGYYYDAKRKGLLEETGLRQPRTRMARS